MEKIICYFVCFIAAVVLSGCNYSDKSIISEISEKARAEQKAEQLRDSISESNLPIKDWEIQTEIDEMTDAKRYLAILMSNNTIVQDFPYGETKALIGIRHTKKYGNETFIKISSGQIHGSEYNGSNYIEVRFDDRPSKKYTYSEEASGSSDVIFINKSKDFIENCKKSKSIKIKIPMFQEGRKLFTFNSNSFLIWNH